MIWIRWEGMRGSVVLFDWLSWQFCSDILVRRFPFGNQRKLLHSFSINTIVNFRNRKSRCRWPHKTIHKLPSKVHHFHVTQKMHSKSNNKMASLVRSRRPWNTRLFPKICDQNASWNMANVMMTVIPIGHCGVINEGTNNWWSVVTGSIWHSSLRHLYLDF